MEIRTYREEDEKQVVELWKACGLVMPWNNPARDIERKLDENPELFFVGEREGEIVAACMSGYDGHRGWIYYLGVKPELQKTGGASRMVDHAEGALKALGCPKINLMVRESNTGVISFYRKNGYERDPVVVLSKRLYEDEPFEEGP